MRCARCGGDSRAARTWSRWGLRWSKDVMVGPLRPLKVSEAGLQGHNASLPPCVAAKCPLSMMGNGARADVGMPVRGHAAVAFGYEVEGCWHVYDAGL
jgi:hypothetical protein